VRHDLLRPGHPCRFRGHAIADRATGCREVTTESMVWGRTVLDFKMTGVERWSSQRCRARSKPTCASVPAPGTITPGRSPGPRPRTKSSRPSPPTATELKTQDPSWGHSRISGIVQGWTVDPATSAGLLPIPNSYRVSVHNHRSWRRAHLRHRSVRVFAPEGCEPVLTATWPSQQTAQRRAAASPLQHRAGLGRPYVAHPRRGQLQADASHRLADD